MKDIPLVKGAELDYIALQLGLKRHRKFLIFKESDKHLRSRVNNRIEAVCNRQLYVLGVGAV